jgi:hypothetical protein
MEGFMNIRDIMKYVESEYEVINCTPCEMCGGDYFADALELSVVNGEAFDICECVCSNCGHERDFVFSAPFINPKLKKAKRQLN